MNKRFHLYKVTLRIGSTMEKSKVSTKIYKTEIESLKMEVQLVICVCKVFQTGVSIIHINQKLVVYK